MSEIIKVLALAGKEFYQVLEGEIENTFKSDLLMGVNSEMEAVQAAPELGGGTNAEEAKRAKLLQDREGMMQALAAFSDAHLVLIQTKDDTMQGQMSGWMTSFFDDKQKKLRDRNRARIIEIKNLTENILFEIDGVWNPENDMGDEDDDA